MVQFTAFFIPIVTSMFFNVIVLTDTIKETVIIAIRTGDATPKWFEVI